MDEFRKGLYYVGIFRVSCLPVYYLANGTTDNSISCTGTCIFQVNYEFFFYLIIDIRLFGTILDDNLTEIIQGDIKTGYTVIIIFDDEISLSQGTDII